MSHSSARSPSRRAAGFRHAAVVLLALTGVYAAPTENLAPAGAWAAPEPSPVPKRWELDVAMGEMRLATADTALGPRVFTYITYKAVNNSGTDLLFAPSFELSTSQGDLIRSGRGVPADVTRTLIDNLANPYLEDQISVIGPMLQGQANAKEGMAVWPLPSLTPGEITVYAAGFSGETATVDVVDPVTNQPTRKVLRKTLMLRYRVPGELDPHSTQGLELIEKRWIMR